MSETPDSISLENLKRFYTEKKNKYDFTNPKVSQSSISDLSFLLTLFLDDRFETTSIHQQVFLADILVTRLRHFYQAKLQELSREKSPNIKLIQEFTKCLTFMQITERMLDSMVSLQMEKLSIKDTLPSYSLVRSLGVDIRPHELTDWVKSVQND